jgi:hypothetical protein
MDSPPPLPDKPFGRTFYVLLFAPIVVMAVAAGVAWLSRGDLGDIGDIGDLGILLAWVSMAAMLVCSIICSIIAGRRWGGWMGLVAFVCIQALYIGVTFVGCATVVVNSQ